MDIETNYSTYLRPDEVAAILEHFSSRCTL
jgi:hypothetical protein